MSLINKVLQDLDERHAMAQPDGTLPPQQVRAVPPEQGGRDWFWRLVALLMLVALAWVGWVAYQIRPKPALATELAIEAAGKAKAGAKKASTPAATPASTAAPASAKNAVVSAQAASAQDAKQPAVLSPKPGPGKITETAQAPSATPAPLDLFKLAPAIETPIKPRTAESAAARTKSRPGTPVATAAPGSTATPRVEKHDESADPGSRAEREYRRASALLDQGRLSEAETALVAALAADPGHEHARQSLVALLIDQRRTDEAQLLLQQGLDRNPANARFAMVLARIQAGRAQYAAALQALVTARPQPSEEAEFQSLRGALLQRLGRSEQAADAYRAALRLAPDNGVSWIGLAVSLDSLQRGKEAGDAFRRALATGTLSAEVRAYAEQRARALP